MPWSCPGPALALPSSAALFQFSEMSDRRARPWLGVWVLGRRAFFYAYARSVVTNKIITAAIILVLLGIIGLIIYLAVK